MSTPKQQESIWQKLKEKSDTFIYGFGPLLWAIVAFTESRAYTSSYTLAL